MACTTRSDFGHGTEAKEVAQHFADRISRRTILITGVNKDGIGFPTAEALAAHEPSHLILAGRNESKVQICIDALKAQYPNVDCRFLQIDLSSQDSVRAAANTVLSWADVPTIEILINSAGVMGIQERTLTPEGIEMHFATNHIGHWLLTCLIMPKLTAAARDQPKGTVRIVNVSSASPQVSCMRWSDMTFERKNKELPDIEQPLYKWFEAWGYSNVEEMSYVPIDGYNRSKVANLLFAVGTNHRLFEKHGILSLAVHPGIIMTELGRQFPPETMQAIEKMMKNGLFTMKSLGAGGATSLVAALDPLLSQRVGETKDGKENWGVYLDDCQISGKAHPLAISKSEAEKLWETSEQLSGERFAW